MGQTSGSRFMLKIGRARRRWILVPPENLGNCMITLTKDSEAVLDNKNDCRLPPSDIPWLCYGR